MRKLLIYTAMSLNGKIAKTDGDVHWLHTLPNPNKEDYGFHDFYASIDTTIQGGNTYRQIIGWNIEFPYKGKTNYVFTRNASSEDTEHVHFVTQNHLDFVKQLKAETGDDIWAIGGGQLNTILYNAGLVDEFWIFVMPIILPGGIDVFEQIPNEAFLELIESKTYTSGAVMLKYRVAQS